MRFKCPNCDTIRSAEAFPCPTDTCIREAGPIIRLMERDYWIQWQQYLESFRNFREQSGARVKNPEAYEAMPFAKGENELLESTWVSRRADWNLIQDLLKNRSNLHILNFGSWNGWLSHQLSKLGHQVVATSQYDDPYDGLGAVQHYSTDWISIQSDQVNLDFLVEPFDLIVMNRCISFHPDPMQIVNTLLEKLKPGGQLLITGMDYYQKPEKRKRFVDQQFQEAFDKFGINLNPNGVKGYLDQGDIQYFRGLGGKIYYYPPVWKNRYAAYLRPNRALYAYGILKKGSNFNIQTNS